MRKQSMIAIVKIMKRVRENERCLCIEVIPYYFYVLYATNGAFKGRSTSLRNARSGRGRIDRSRSATCMIISCVDNYCTV